jgi:muramoyltetrapeptide carboxypeptidase
MYDQLTSPPQLVSGDVVAIVSPSAPAVAWWPHRVERGRAYLRSLGLEPRLMPHAAEAAGWTSGPSAARAADINAAFADDEVKAVLAAIGGNHSNQLLPHLDYELIGANPKIFQGYSDITILHWALMKRCGLRTFHGPALTTQLGEYPAVLPYTDRFLRAAWFGDEPLVFAPAEQWTDELLDFFAKADLTRPRQLKPSDGWLSLRDGQATGPLVGGCLETICWHLKGSSVWLDLNGTILFLETSEEAPSPAAVDAYLTDLEQLGVFDQINALIFGRPYGYAPERVEQLCRVVRERTSAAGIPVLANVDLGHTDPMLTLPLGVTADVDTAAARFALAEAATAARELPPT